MKEINKQKEVGSMENDGIAAPGILLAQQSGTLALWRSTLDTQLSITVKMCIQLPSVGMDG